MRLAWAAVLPYQIVIPRWSGGPGPRLRERLGYPSEPAGVRPGGLWLHAVSVGEVRLALPLLEGLRDRLPERSIHLTTGTAGGRALAEAAHRRGVPPGPDSLSALPFDFPGPMRRILDRLAPCAVVLLETEIWPNLLRLCGRRGTPVVLANGRISPRSFPRYRAVRRFLRRVLADVRLFGMQSEEDAERIVGIGAPRDRVSVTGNLKFDLPVPDAESAEVRRRLGLRDRSPLFLAGSTAPGEESPVLEAYAMLRQFDPRARLIFVPRHPEDASRAEAAFRSARLNTARWSRTGAGSAGGPPGGATEGPAARHQVLIVDAVGLLPELYAAADVVFVGGSLVPRGGHNILEPAALGKPVLFGPHVENFRSAARTLVAAGGGFVVRDGRALGQLGVRLLSDRDVREAAASAARQVVRANRGAMRRTLDMIQAIIPPSAAGRRAPARA
ncbi:MAG: 3-deoxy-D-manno-octulosonic acid transferase [Acidobacteriota bacterium]